MPLNNFKFFLKKKLDVQEKKLLAEKLPFLDQKITKVTFGANYLSLNFLKNFKIDEIKKKKIENFIQKFLYHSNPVEGKVIYESDHITKKKNNNYFKELLNKKYIRKIDNGIYSKESDFLKFKNNIDTFLKKRLTDNRYIETAYSGMLPVKSLVKNSYISSFPHQCVFVSFTKRELKSLKNLTNLKNDNSKDIKKNIQNPDYMMSPTICYNCFETLKKQKMKKSQYYTSIGNCYRYEGLNYKNFERLKIYEMREWIIFGKPKIVELEIKRILDKLKKILNNWKIQFRIVSASDPFFLNEKIKKKIFQLSFKLKYELEFFLPYEKKWIAVASFNNHLDSIVKNYDIKSTNNLKINSGCIGIGYERFLYALYSQKGIFKV
jgi:seryl-tRNA synthetase